MMTSFNVGLTLMVLFLCVNNYQIHLCNGDEVYKVGDSAGWTTIGNVDYKQWAASKNFQVGDTIVFEYNPKFHNVLQVTHAEYKSCNATSAISTHTTGNDSITITGYGHHFFLCGVPGHCQSGQKVDINVIKASAPSPVAAAQPATPAGAVFPSPTPPSAVAPAPSDASSSCFALYDQVLVINVVLSVVIVFVTLPNFGII